MGVTMVVPFVAVIMAVIVNAIFRFDLFDFRSHLVV